MSTNRVLGCRLSESEWEDFYSFRKDVLPNTSSTAALRVLLQLALSVTGHCRDLWKDTDQYVPEGWFTNTMIAVAKQTGDPAKNGENGKKTKKKPGKKPGKKPAAEIGGEA